MDDRAMDSRAIDDRGLDDPGTQIAEALGSLLRRGARSGLYRELTAGLGDAVDELTYPVLSGLARTGPRTAAALADEVGLDRSGVSRYASRLETAGLVRRRPDPADGRAVMLTLTDAGSRTVAVLRARLAEHITASISDWPYGEVAAFARMLRKFAQEGPFGPDA
jgi:DNA-binding MarR family transcriptional regulator